MTDVDEAAFLAAIRADPDPAARLVFADWLDERGRPGDAERAEFIRLQCTLADLPDGDERGPRLLRRERELLDRCRAIWLAPLAITGRAVFHCGFPEEVEIEAGRFAASASAIFSLPLRKLSVVRASPRDFPADALLARPDLARLRGFGVVGSVPGTRLRDLLASPSLAGLRDLSLSCPRPLASGGIENLLASPMPAVESLGLEFNRLGPESASALARWAGLARLRRLDLSENELGPDGAAALAETDCPALSSLDLAQNFLYERGVANLARASGWPALDSLDLTRNHCGDGGLRALLASPLAAGLTELNLGHNALGAASAELLAGWPGLARLRTLRLFGNPMPPRSWSILAESPHWGMPRRLDLSYVRLDDEAVEVWAASPSVRGLRELSLWGGTFGEPALRALLDSPMLPRTLHLRIDGNACPPALLGALRERFDYVT